MDLHLTITNSAKRDHPSSCTRASWRENLHPFHGIPFHLSTSQLFNPTRSTIQFRSYRANFPSPEYDSTRTLTSIVYSHASEQGRGSSPVVKDDTAYLFLEDRMGSVSTLSNTVDIVSSSKSLDEDGFEIVEAPLATLAPSSSGPPRTPPSHPQPQSQSQTHQEPSTQPQTAAQPESQIQTISHPLLAVRPATNVTQLLHSLLSGFVLGMTKSARAVRLLSSSTQIHTVSIAETVRSDSINHISASRTYTAPRQSIPTHIPHISTPTSSKPTTRTDCPHPAQPHRANHLSRGRI